MRPNAIFVLAAILVSALVAHPALGSRPVQSAAPPEPIGGVHVRFDLAAGIHAYVPRTGGSTATVVVGDGEAVVVDPHSTPAQAEALAQEIRALGDVEVRWIVNSHWHGDHHGGNAALREQWPGARILQHRRTASAIATRATMERGLTSAFLASRAEAAEALLAEDTALDPAQRRQLRRYAREERRLAGGETRQVYLQGDVLMDRPLLLRAAGRVLEVRPVPPAHTEGDLYVWIPRDRVLVAGDLLTAPYVVPRSGFPRSYASVLRSLDRLPFAKLVPGHGAPQDDGHERLRTMADLLDTVAGVAVEVAAASEVGREWVPDVMATPAVAAFEARIPWDEPHAMRFLDFPGLVEMIAVRALQEHRAAFVHSDVESGFASIPGARVRYDATGQGEPLVLVHGGYMDRRMWDPQFAAFAAAGYRVIRYDVAGFGDTQIDDPTAPRSATEDLGALLDALEIVSAHIVGLSMGGTIAIDFALASPERVRSLVLAETRPSGLPLPQQRRGEMGEVHRLAEEGRRDAAIRALLQSPIFVTAVEEPEALAAIERMVGDNFTLQLPPPAEEEPAIERLHAITAPTLLLQGDAGSGDREHVVRVLREGVPSLELAVIEGGGHMLNLERPDRFNELVVAFLARVTGL